MKKAMVVMLALVILLSGCSSTTKITTTKTAPVIPVIATVATTRTAVTTKLTENTTISSSTESIKQTSAIETSAISGEMSVHFIDVGQADCILLKQGSASMLIDAGNNADASLVVSYLQKQGITKLDYVVGTHPHEDHIGGLDNVINSFEIGKVILPNIQNNTQTFEDLLLAIQSKNVKITKPEVGQTFQLGSASFQILGPVAASYSDLNNYSVVIKASFGATSFMLMGDAEFESESQILAKGFDVHATVLKVGHHGSDSSTSSSFLKAVSLQSAVISVGKNNTYGHPTEGTLGNLLAVGINIFRTDIAGTIIATSNGTKVSFNTAPNGSVGVTEAAATTIKSTTASVIAIPTTNTAEVNKKIVYITATGTKYHRPTCSYLSKSKFETELSSAVANGLTPCSVCKP